MILFLLLACSPRIPDCADNETYDADGNCIERDTSLSDHMQQIVDDMPACELLEPGDRLDLRFGCADGACAEQTYSEMTGVMGDGDCEDSGYGLIRCEWQDGLLSAYIWDTDKDGLPDGNEINEGVHIHDDWAGTDERGLGMQVSLACFVDVYGDTDFEQLDYFDDGDLYGINWPDRGIYVNDIDTNGYVDLLSIFGVY